jgi:hypothetical protein
VQVCTLVCTCDCCESARFCAVFLCWGCASHCSLANKACGLSAAPCAVLWHVHSGTSLKGLPQVQFQQ